MTTNKKLIAAVVSCDLLKPVVLFSYYLQGDIYFSRVNARQKVLHVII